MVESGANPGYPKTASEGIATPPGCLQPSLNAVNRRVSAMMTRLLSPRKLLAQIIAAVAIVGFWCISAVGTTVGTTIGATSLAAVVTTATATTAEAGRRRRRRRRRRKRSRRWWGGKWVPWWAYDYY